MTASLKAKTPSLLRHIPSELSMTLAFAVAIFGVVATGSAIAAALDDPSVWLVAASYGGPAAVAFGLYWAIAQRL